MMFLLYKEGLRIVITTANLIARDWDQKTQGYRNNHLLLIFLSCEAFHLTFMDRDDLSVLLFIVIIIIIISFFLAVNK